MSTLTLEQFVERRKTILEQFAADRAAACDLHPEQFPLEQDKDAWEEDLLAFESAQSFEPGDEQLVRRGDEDTVPMRSDLARAIEKELVVTTKLEAGGIDVDDEEDLS
jgi:hypothetical protein